MNLDDVNDVNDDDDADEDDNYDDAGDDADEDESDAELLMRIVKYLVSIHHSTTTSCPESNNVSSLVIQKTSGDNRK